MTIVALPQAIIYFMIKGLKLFMYKSITSWSLLTYKTFSSKNPLSKHCKGITGHFEAQVV